MSQALRSDSAIHAGSVARPAPGFPGLPGLQRWQLPLRLVAPSRSTPRLPFILLTVIVVVAGVLALLALNVSVNQQAFQASRLERDNMGLEAQYTHLRAEIDQLSTPDQIARKAAARGLVLATHIRVARWPGTTTSPGAATSPAAPGDGTSEPTWKFEPGDPLKRYLAER